VLRELKKLSAGPRGPGTVSSIESDRGKKRGSGLFSPPKMRRGRRHQRDGTMRSRKITDRGEYWRTGPRYVEKQAASGSDRAGSEGEISGCRRGGGGVEKGKEGRPIPQEGKSLTEATKCQKMDDESQ